MHVLRISLSKRISPSRQHVVLFRSNHALHAPTTQSSNDFNHFDGEDLGKTSLGQTHHGHLEKVDDLRMSIKHRRDMVYDQFIYTVT